MTISRLERHEYPHLDEVYYRGLLDNGLRVYLMPKPDFQETYAVMTADFGAVDTIFVPPHQSSFVEYPAGIAHFLEHKIFETEDGEDVLNLFGQLGASANAFTSFNQTSYMFSTIDNTLESLALLQRFLQTPNFTAASIAREQGIIKQEIEMYLDDPDHLLFTGVLANLYPNTPLAQDIAGSPDSILQITAENLYENFEVFYQPSNMSLFVIGNFDLEAVWVQIEAIQNEQALKEVRPIHRYAIPHNPVIKSRQMSFEVAQPKLALGLRGNDVIEAHEVFRYKVALKLLFSMLFGWTSQRYQTWYDQGKIDSSFNFEIELTEHYHFVLLMLDTAEPIALSTQFRRAIKNFATDPDVSAQHLQTLKNEMYGEFLRALNHMEMTAQQFVAHLGQGANYLDLPDILYTLSFEEVLAYGHRFITHCEMTDFTIFPE